MADFLLTDVDVVAVSLCKRGANGKRFFLKKMEGDDDKGQVTVEAPLLKLVGDDWRVVYSVVAEPGNVEKAGVGAGADPTKTDEWATPEDIRKAAHSFMRNGGLINFQHASLDPVGRVVENFISPIDFEVVDPAGTKQVIKKGAWCIGIEPNDDLRTLIDAGVVDSVSYEGTGLRHPVAKADPAKGSAYRKCKGCDAKMASDASKCQNCGKAYIAKDTPIPNKPGVTNWIEQHGGLPKYMREVAEDLLDKHPGQVGKAIQLAIGIVRNWAEGHDGHGNKVSAATQAKAAKAVAEYEKMRAATKLKKGQTMGKLMDKIAKAVGLSDEEIVELNKTIEDDSLSDEERALLSGSATLGTTTTTEEHDVALTDQEKQALAKVEGIETKVAEFDTKVSALDGKLDAVLSRLPEPSKSPEEERTELQKSLKDLTEAAEGIQERLAKLEEGGSTQGADLKKNTDNLDEDAALAQALFG